MDSTAQPDRPASPGVSRRTGRLLWQALRWPHQLPAWLSFPTRVLLLGLCVFVTLFPNLDLMVREARRQLGIRPPPSTDALRDWLTLLDAEVPATLPHAEQVPLVEVFTNKHVPYRFDWDLYGNMQHTPTLDDMWRVRADDCDGQAILALNLLRARGIKSRLQNDISHVWVWTPHGAILGPGQGSESVAEDGTPTYVFQFEDWVRSTSFGIRLFPRDRELLWVIVGLWLLVPWRHWGLAWPMALFVTPAMHFIWLSAGLRTPSHTALMWYGWTMLLASLLPAMLLGPILRWGRASTRIAPITAHSAVTSR